MAQPSPLAVVQQRALALRAAGDLPAARRLLTDTIASARPGYGEDHPDVLSTAHLLARMHREADDPAGARRVLEEAYAAGERRWNPADPLMLAICFDLAQVAEELGNRHEARRNFTRVATHGPAVLGEQHAAVRVAQQYLGVAAAPTPLHAPVGSPPTAPHARPVLPNSVAQPGPVVPPEPVRSADPRSAGSQGWQPASPADGRTRQASPPVHQPPAPHVPLPRQQLSAPPGPRPPAPTAPYQPSVPVAHAGPVAPA
ncbi:tetratricopeptide repeat protein, partial [Micromonospora sp. KC606]|uniref:tetratricopeptide repeat protein n=1 Tax=Micromonospora sp. KC606 TaxID=2530379 RepID=UPI001A9CCDDA